jgi:hypothetical protein
VSENSSEWPRILTDEANREPYKSFQQSKGPLNQIRIKTGTGSLVDLGDRSKIVAAIKPFRLFRLYLADAAEDASRFIETRSMGECMWTGERKRDVQTVADVIREAGE